MRFRSSSRLTAGDGETVASGLGRRRGARIFLAASGVAQVCALLRYTVLARLLGPEQLGLAATLILTSQFFESISDSGSDRFLIQDADGDSTSVQKLVQLVFASRGALIAAGLIALSGAIAALYRAPELAPALMVLSISPFIYGFLNLDMRRLQRHNDFRIEGLAMLLSESVAVVATVAAAFALRNFTAILFGLIARSLVVVIVSHATAERRYALAFSRENAGRLARFAAPLMLNGGLLFFGSQGDRVLVANRLGVAELGHYSAVLLLIYYPSSMLGRYIATMHLPRVAAGRANGKDFDRAVDSLAGQALLLGLMMSCGFAVVGPTAVRVLFGSKFTEPILTVCLIGILQSTRFIRIWPTTAALGVGRSGIVLGNNVARLVGLPCALVGAHILGGLTGMVGGLILGEFIALATALGMLGWSGMQRAPYSFDRFAIIALAAVLEFAWVQSVQAPSAARFAALLAATAGVLFWIAVREGPTLRAWAGRMRLLPRRAARQESVG